ncbi:nucleoid-associated protein [Clostridium estertheticum]|uniref:Nucleoid-associated protein n=1 Tax=Clostridium estertheticum TaxID=238834 RepID=A0AA47I756_9CLOT|nr:nucleoid-associated protein [Clostridium estertheticum]MBU3155199.1 nucleoid-associated protein [Clostridium estertheticum]WAG61253.1 nucleoid-associated protein [Clostridium estertheticum]
MEFKNLKINKIIIHEIFKRNFEKGVVEPKFNHTLSVLDEAGLEVLTERVINAIGNKSNSMEMEIKDSSNDSCVYLINSMLNCDDETFIKDSQTIAHKLAESQTSRRIPGGVVIVFSGTIGLNNTPITGVIKAEIHSGFTRTITESNEEILKYLSDLLLTPQQKLYKIAVFIKNNDGEENNSKLEEKYNVFVYDNNMKKSETKEAALYFYDTFLGSTFKRNSKVITKDFYEGTKEFINILEITDEEKIDLNLQLYSYIKSPINASISIEDFSDNSFEAEVKDSYNDYMVNKNIPTTLIQKDNQYIENRLKQRKIKFFNEISIAGPSENFNNLVKIIGTDDYGTTLKVGGKIKYQQ